MSMKISNIAYKVYNMYLICHIKFLYWIHIRYPGHLVNDIYFA